VQVLLDTATELAQKRTNVAYAVYAAAKLGHVDTIHSMVAALAPVAQVMNAMDIHCVLWGCASACAEDAPPVGAFMLRLKELLMGHSCTKLEGTSTGRRPPGFVQPYILAQLAWSTAALRLYEHASVVSYILDVVTCDSARDTACCCLASASCAAC
jgi:hypothetical protein